VDRRRLLAPLVALTAILAVPSAAAAVPGDLDGRGADARPHISASLDEVAVDSSTFQGLADAFRSAHDTVVAAKAHLVELGHQERALAAEEARAGAEVRLAGILVERWDDRLAALAARTYVEAGEDRAATDAGEPDGYSRTERRALLAGVVDAAWRAELDAATRRLERATERRDRARADRAAVVAEQGETEARRDRAEAEVRRLRPEMARARATATVVGTDLTLVALDAYLRAAFDVHGESPECRLPWWLLAGIGRTESGHGTFADSVLSPAGVATPPILGIALDGGGGTAAISDTDRGRLDGDTRVDRAVGPMQFIPSTWARYASDGDHDGVSDPQNLYDAALAAGRYLCAASSGLDAEAGRVRAILAYNHSQAYVSTVSGFAAEYARVLL